MCSSSVGSLRGLYPATQTLSRYRYGQRYQWKSLPSPSVAREPRRDLESPYESRLMGSGLVELITYNSLDGCRHQNANHCFGLRGESISTHRSDRAASPPGAACRSMTVHILCLAQISMTRSRCLNPDSLMTLGLLSSSKCR